MIVQLGNPSPHQNIRKEVNPSDFDAEGLKAEAEKAGVDASGTKAEIAARLSAASNFVPVPFEAYPGEEAITTISFPEDRTLGDAFVEITNASQGVWAHHSAEPPSWVASDNPALAMILAAHFGDIPVVDLIVPEEAE